MRSRTLEESVYDALEERILTGCLKPGAPLTEQDACVMTGASRTPVREALHRLAEEGLIAMTPNRSAVVVGITKRDLIDIYGIRRGVEGLASRLAAERLTEADRERLLETVELQEFYLEKGAVAKLKELDNAFHNMIYEIGGSRIITATLSRLHRQIGRYRQISLDAGERTALSVSEHRAIADAILARDADLAERLTVSHIENACKNLMNVLEED